MSARKPPLNADVTQPPLFQEEIVAAFQVDPAVIRQNIPPARPKTAIFNPYHVTETNVSGWASGAAAWGEVVPEAVVESRALREPVLYRILTLNLAALQNQRKGQVTQVSYGGTLKGLTSDASLEVAERASVELSKLGTRILMAYARSLGEYPKTRDEISDRIPAHYERYFRHEFGKTGEVFQANRQVERRKLGLVVARSLGIQIALSADLLEK